MISNRVFTWCLVCLPIACSRASAAPATAPAEEGKAKLRATLLPLDDAKSGDWLARWHKHITGEMHNRFCDSAMGEEIGWLMTPFLEGFYGGYQATGDTQWVERCIEWADAWVQRGVKEPDGYLGWPKLEAAGTQVDGLNGYNADSMLGEAMVLRPIVLMAGEIQKTPALQARYAAKATSYLELSRRIYEKWEQRGGWRASKNNGEISLVMPYGIDTATGRWTDGYEQRNVSTIGFSHPDNKANAVGRWLLAMSDVTQQPEYKQRAARWFRLQKSRMKPKADGTFAIWNYWEPAGPWDYKPDGSPKHWVGVHPNAGYYEIDVEAIVDAYQHGLVFNDEDIQRLIATALVEKRPWSALAPYSREIQQALERELKPESWAGLAAMPRYLALQRNLRGSAK